MSKTAKWIPVSERLPEYKNKVLLEEGGFYYTSDPVLCIRKSMAGRHWSNRDYTKYIVARLCDDPTYGDRDYWIDPEEGSSLNVEYWMPLPAPPQPGAEEKPLPGQQVMQL